MALLGSFLTDVLAVISILAAAVYYWLTSNYDYWEKRKVPFLKPSFPFGNFGKSFVGSESFTTDLISCYRQLKPHGFGGVFSVRSPILLVCKPELIKQILTKDFSSFHDRGIPFNEEHDPFSGNLFNLGGQRWKDLRSKLSPTFTSGKIKGMFPLIEECTKDLKDAIRVEMKKKDGSVEMQDLLVRFTTDVIGTCAFGVNCNSLKDPNAEFYLMGREIFKISTTTTILTLLVALFPKLVLRFATVRNLIPNTTKFFQELMERTVRYRKDFKVERKDFVDLMIKIMDEDNEGLKFTQDNMVAQAFLFFSAGLDNVSNNVGFCLHAMAVDQDLQERVYNEIISVLNDYNGEMSYEALGHMELLSRVLDEGLRLYTPAGVLIRAVTEENYKIPGTDIVIPKKTAVMIPTYAIHLDEEIYPDPKKFDPDRFTEEEKAKRHPYEYIPFGEGPRFCIASRFAQLEMKLCLAELLRQFNFSVAPETDVSLELNPKQFSPNPKNKFWLRVTERETD